MWLTNELEKHYNYFGGISYYNIAYDYAAKNFKTSKGLHFFPLFTGFLWILKKQESSGIKRWLRKSLTLLKCHKIWKKSEKLQNSTLLINKSCTQFVVWPTSYFRHINLIKKDALWGATLQYANVDKIKLKQSFRTK